MGHRPQSVQEYFNEGGDLEDEDIDPFDETTDIRSLKQKPLKMGLPRKVVTPITNFRRFTEGN